MMVMEVEIYNATDVSRVALSKLITLREKNNELGCSNQCDQSKHRQHI